MKVLHIIDTLSLGGAQSILKAVFEKEKQNTDWYIYALRKKDITIDIDHPNIHIHPSNAKYSFSPLSAMKQLIIRENIQILHCHLFRSEVFGVLLKQLYFPEIQLIVHEHGQIVGSDLNSKVEDRAYVTFKKMSKNKVDLGIAVSNAMKKFLMQRASISGEAIKTIYNFVDLRKFDPEKMEKFKREGSFRRKWTISPGDFVIGFAGRLIKRKGWRTFLETARLLVARHKHYHFLIAGNGADREAMMELITHYNLGSQVHYVGYVDNMLEFYAALDCFAMPSHFEGLPMSQLEVMALGIPLITADGPGMDEVPQNGKDALYMKMKNPEDLARLIEKLEAEPELRLALSINAQKTVQQYNLDWYVDSLKEVYQNVNVLIA